MKVGKKLLRHARRVTAKLLISHAEDAQAEWISAPAMISNSSHHSYQQHHREFNLDDDDSPVRRGPLVVRNPDPPNTSTGQPHAVVWEEPFAYRTLKPSRSDPKLDHENNANSDIQPRSQREPSRLGIDSPKNGDGSNQLLRAVPEEAEELKPTIDLFPRPLRLSRRNAIDAGKSVRENRVALGIPLVAHNDQEVNENQHEGRSFARRTSDRAEKNQADIPTPSSTEDLTCSSRSSSSIIRRPCRRCATNGRTWDIRHGQRPNVSPCSSPTPPPIVGTRLRPTPARIATPPVPVIMLTPPSPTIDEASSLPRSISTTLTTPQSLNDDPRPPVASISTTIKHIPVSRPVKTDVDQYSALYVWPKYIERLAELNAHLQQVETVLKSLDLLEKMLPSCES